MNFLRRHWYDVGLFLAVPVLAHILISYHELGAYQVLMWSSLASLFLHQSEEYRIAGTFPGMVNTVMYRSSMPDRYPLNTNTAFFVNVAIGWTAYLLAAALGESAVWLGIATMLVSAGNIVAHTVVFNIRGRTFYNAGLVTSLLLFLPCTCMFISMLRTGNIATATDYLIGIPLGIVLNVAGILKLIDWMADINTPYIFPERNLLRRDRKGRIAKTIGKSDE